SVHAKLLSRVVRQTTDDGGRFPLGIVEHVEVIEWLAYDGRDRRRLRPTGRRIQERHPRRPHLLAELVELVLRTPLCQAIAADHEQGAKRQDKRSGEGADCRGRRKTWIAPHPLSGPFAEGRFLRMPKWEILKLPIEVFLKCPGCLVTTSRI